MNDSRRFGEPPADLFNPFQRQTTNASQEGSFNPLRAGLGRDEHCFHRRAPAEKTLDIPEEKSLFERQIYVDRNRPVRALHQQQEAQTLRIASSLSTAWSRGLEVSEVPVQLPMPARRKSVDLLIVEIMKLQDKLETTDSQKYHMQREQEDLSRQLGLLRDRSKQLEALHSSICGKLDELFSYKVVDQM